MSEPLRKAREKMGFTLRFKPIKRKRRGECILRGNTDL